MLRTIQLSAIAFGLFVGFLLPHAMYLGVGSAIAYTPLRTAPGAMALLSIIWWPILFGSPVLGGYLSARVAQTQPLLHGFIVGVLEACAALLWDPSMFAFTWGLIVFVPGAIVGAWIYKHSRPMTNAL